MKLGYVMAPGRGETNRLLAGLAEALAQDGLRLAGTVQIDTARPKTDHCDMDVQVLPAGPILRISQDLGPNARGCRLNPDALEEAVTRSAAAIEAGTDLLIINKFGKHEAEGRGFRELIGEALARGIPVIAGTNKLNIDAFRIFSGDCAEALPVELAELTEKAREFVASDSAAA